MRVGLDGEGKRSELPPSNQGAEMEGRETWQVDLIRFDFHLYPPLPLFCSPSTSRQPNHSLNLKIDGGLYDFLISTGVQREQSS